MEEASTLGWDRYVGHGGAIVGMHTFGASAPSNSCSLRRGAPSRRRAPWPPIPPCGSA
ncbi:hypothetical protein [Streptomyces sp. NPDC007917]|uniref:transketolase-like TK C-terminal-containing protein n=1 Tax=Streptomyces sp. NPDC007917 TaxID=3364793 RepID=UPI0036EBFF36